MECSCKWFHSANHWTGGDLICGRHRFPWGNWASFLWYQVCPIDAFTLVFEAIVTRLLLITLHEAFGETERKRKRW
jgi:hypothetical protein